MGHKFHLARRLKKIYICLIQLEYLIKSNSYNATHNLRTNGDLSIGESLAGCKLSKQLATLTLNHGEWRWRE